MDLLQAIFNRRTARAFTAEPISDQVLERILAAGTWAPSHANTQPWEFIIIGPVTRGKLAESYREAMEAGPLKNPEMPEEHKELMRRFIQNFGDAPVLLAVTCPPPATELDRYDYPLTGGAVIQNMFLAAWQEKVAGVWISFGYTPQARSILGIEAGGIIGGILALGYPAVIPPAQPRIPVSDKTRRLP